MSAILNLTKLFKFKGGVHPPEHKLESTSGPILPLPMPARLVLPLRQHVGNIPKIRVEAGQHVLKGQLLAEAEAIFRRRCMRLLPASSLPFRKT